MCCDVAPSPLSSTTAPSAAAAVAVAETTTPKTLTLTMFCLASTYAQDYKLNRPYVPDYCTNEDFFYFCFVLF